MQDMPNNFSDRELSLARWFIYHKSGVRRVSLGVLLGIIALSWGYFFFALLNTHLIDFRARTERIKLLTASQVPLGAHTQDAPEPLVISPATEVGSGASSATLTTIQNPNADWIARFSYLPPGSKSLTTLSVAPNDRAYLFGVAAENTASGSLDANAIAWQLVKKQDISDIEEYKKAHRNFIVKDAAYTADLTQDKKTTINHVTFTITNATPWSYWQVPVLALLYQGNRVAAARQVVFDQFKTGETRRGDSVISDPIGGVSSIEIIPQIDMFDLSAYMPLPQTIPQEPGT